MLIDFCLQGVGLRYRHCRSKKIDGRKEYMADDLVHFHIIKHTRTRPITGSILHVRAMDRFKINNSDKPVRVICSLPFVYNNIGIRVQESTEEVRKVMQLVDNQRVFNPLNVACLQ